MNKKIKTEKEIAQVVGDLKKQGKKIVTTNGSFDIFHYGHVIVLEESKKQGDILIVGVNSDKSVKGYKGTDRPINPEKARMGVVAAVEAVNYVFLFDDPTPNGWLEVIKPDIHCTSSEYGQNCPERPALDKVGIKLHLVERDLNDSLSTTEILNKLKT